MSEKHTTAWRCGKCDREMPDFNEAQATRPVETTLEERVSQSIREEIVRQYRDDERGKCPAGSAFYEEHVAPTQIARVAIRDVLAWLEWR